MEFCPTGFLDGNECQINYRVSYGTNSVRLTDIFSSSIENYTYNPTNQTLTGFITYEKISQCPF